MVDDNTKIFFEAMESAPEGIVLWDADGRLVMCNDKFRELHQSVAKEIVKGLKIEDLLRQLKDSGVIRIVDGEPAGWDNIDLALHQRKAGVDVVVHYSDKWIQIRRKKLANGNVIAFHTDITEVKKSEERFRIVFDTSPALIGISTAEDAKILDVNQTWLKTLGFERSEVIGKTPFDIGMLLDQTIRKRAIQNLDDDMPVGLETQYRTKNGEIRDFLVSGERIEFKGQDCYLFISQDITNRKLSEEQSRFHQEQLAHVNRVATMGEMATGIAHELNQPLAAISAYIDGSLRRLKIDATPSDSIVTALEKASEQALRAGDVVRHLRDFVRREDRISENVNINDSILITSQMMKASLDFDQIRLKLDLAQESPMIFGDPILIQQVILNLVRNSVDAMKSENSESREIEIRTSLENGYILVGVKDSGPGVHPEHQERLFEPYFSTKETGLGLGLPLCLSIVDEHGGQIWHEHAPTKGANFNIRLPALDSIPNAE